MDNINDNVRHKIVTLNTDRRIETISKLKDAITETHDPHYMTWTVASIICLQDVSNNINLPSTVNWLFDDSYELITTPLFMETDPDKQRNDRREHNNTSEQIILCHKELVHVMNVMLMSKEAYQTNGATAVGISVTLNSEPHLRANNLPVDEFREWLNLFSVYVRPNASPDEVAELLRWINTTANQQMGGMDRTLILGDFNAINPLWNNISVQLDNIETSDKHYTRIRDNRGRQIFCFIRSKKLECLNRYEKKPTFNQSCIDLALTGIKITKRMNTMPLKILNVLQPMNCHKAIMIQYTMIRVHDRPHLDLMISNKTNDNSNRFYTRRIKRYDVSLITDDMFNTFRQECETLTFNWERTTEVKQRAMLDILVDKIHNLTLEIQSNIMRVKTLPRIRRDEARRINDIQKKRAINKTHAIMKKIRANIDRRLIVLAEHKRNKERCLMRELRGLNKNIRLKQRKLTKIMRHMRKLTIKNRQSTEIKDNLWKRVMSANDEHSAGESNTDKTTINLIRKKSDINAIAVDKFPSNKHYKGKMFADRLLARHSRSPRDHRIDINEDEVRLAIKELAGKNYISPQGIKMSVFHKSISNFIYPQAVLAAKMSFRLCHIPEGCQLTKGTLIPKKEPGKYRIVHVSNPMAALLEIIALHRLEYRIEQNKQLDPDQYGFTPNKDRHDLICKILETVTSDDWYANIKKINKITTIIGLDIEGAFDNVNHEKLINKMDIMLGDDKVKLWLAQFVTNRRIMLVYNQFKSKTRDVCSGVPQGSALGPILFNFMINNVCITQHDGSLSRIQLLKYADDLHLIQKGYNQQELQLALNQIRKGLNNVGLDINALKCRCLPINYGNEMARSHSVIVDKYYIGGNEQELIKVTDKLRILGVIFNKTLKLDRINIKAQIHETVAKLFSIQTLDLVQSAKEWRMIIDAFMTSKIIINNWPILIIDKRSRKWIDNEMMRSIKLIFNWPTNVPNKTVRLISNMHPSEMLIKRIIELRATQTTNCEDHLMYDNMKNIFLWSLTRRSNELRPHNLSEIRNADNDDDDLWAELLGSTQLADKDMIRTYPNPELIMPIRLCLRLDNTDFLYNYSPFWFITSVNKDAIAVEAHGHFIMNVKLAKCISYHIPYFSVFALIWDMIMNRRSKNHKIVLEWNSPLLSALENFANHDWRIIKLREQLLIRHWKLVVVNQQHSEIIKQDLSYLHKVINKQGDVTEINHITHENEQDEIWADGRPERLLEDNQQTGEREQRNNNDNHDTPPMIPSFFLNIDREWTNRQVNMIKLNEPRLDDYVMRNVIRSKFRKEVKDCIKNNYMTRICSIIAHRKPEIWQMIPMNWLNGAKMLMLSDLYMDITSGQLLKYDEQNPIEKCEACGQSLMLVSDNNERNEDIMTIRQRDRLHVTLHRVTVCPHFRDQQRRLKMILEQHNRSMTKAFENKAHMTQVLKILTECAMPRVEAE
jgi:hypothetical protein